MDFIGKWCFDSILYVNSEDKLVYVSAEEFLQAPIAEDEPNMRERELRERKFITSSVVVVKEDGTMMSLMGLPEEASKEEIDAAVASGAITLVDGMILDKVRNWEYRDGVAFYDSGIHGELLGEEVDSWKPAIDKDGFINMSGIRYRKCE